MGGWLDESHNPACRQGNAATAAHVCDAEADAASGGKTGDGVCLDDVKELPDVQQIIYITGHLKEKVEEFARGCTDIPSVFVEQKVQDGTAGAVALARKYVDQPVLIIFVDTIFDADLSIIS